MTGPSIPNIFKIPELKEKILFTLLCLLLYRLGAHITVPGIDAHALTDFFKSQNSQTLFGLYDMFAGGALSRATVFGLGIMPYISAQHLLAARRRRHPDRREAPEGGGGPEEAHAVDRYLTVVLAAGQACGIAHSVLRGPAGCRRPPRVGLPPR